MENYEQKYKEALEKAKEFFNSPRTCFDINQLTEIFPELRESEDERIKSAAIEFIRQNRSFNYSLGVSKEEAIAWLEKQGEKKSVSIKETELNSIAFLTKLGYTCIPPKKEQKPAWSEEDEDVIKHLLSICSGAKNYNQFAGCSQNDITKCQDWLKSLKPRWKPTEKQMEALKCSYKSYIIDGKERRTLESLYNDLKSL